MEPKLDSMNRDLNLKLPVRLVFVSRCPTHPSDPASSGTNVITLKFEWEVLCWLFRFVPKVSRSFVGYPLAPRSPPAAKGSRGSRSSLLWISVGPAATGGFDRFYSYRPLADIAALGGQGKVRSLSHVPQSHSRHPTYYRVHHR